MVDVGAFPAIALGGSTAIVGEIYRVDDHGLRALDLLEDVPSLYRRVEMSIGGSNEGKAVPSDPRRGLEATMRIRMQNGSVYEGDALEVVTAMRDSAIGWEGRPILAYIAWACPRGGIALNFEVFVAADERAGAEWFVAAIVDAGLASVE